MPDGYIVVGYVCIVIVSDLAVLHVKLDALQDLLRLEIGQAEAVEGQRGPEWVLQDSRTEVQTLVETDRQLVVALLLIHGRQVEGRVRFLLDVARGQT